jgi:hypothetical protein
MKTSTKIAALVLMAVVTGMSAIADTMKENVKFSNDVIVNGTVLEDGMYRLEFNDQTGTLTFKKDGDIVASAPARLEQVDKHSRVEYTTRTEGESRILVSVTMDDGYRAVLQSP